MPGITPDHKLVLGILSAEGAATSQALQAGLAKSQATVSRLVSGMSDQVLRLGRARSTIYGLPRSIRGEAAQQPIWLTTESGKVQRIGTLSYLARDLIHVDAEFGSSLTQGSLPWQLAPLRAQGFLGRLLARRLELAGVGSDPDQWSLESVLYGALQLSDAPGALAIGDPHQQGLHPHPELGGDLFEDMEAIALDVVQSLPAGSSAGGEQPKFLAIRKADGQHLLVKFTPPRGTPFAERWHDLLVCEDLAGKVLAGAGIAAAQSRVIQSRKRSFLVSERFDRIGRTGRRHAVSIGDAHKAFVPGSYSSWSQTAEALARQRRLDAGGATSAATLQHFGRLIGNSDMHSGNLALFVELAPKPVFSLAPVYDMLPMRWRPDALRGGAPEYDAFTPDPAALSSAAAPMAVAFWERLSSNGSVSKKLRTLASQMTIRLRTMAS
jgi:hypothetical protein